METGTTIAFDPWLLSERRVRTGLRDYLGSMDGVRLLPNKHTLDLDVPAFQTVEPYSNTAGTVRNFADNGNGYNGGNGYRPLDNGVITPADNSGITPVNGSDGPANINSFQNLNFSPDTESQPNNLPNTPDATAPDWQPVEEGNVSKNAELSSPDSFTNEPDGGMVNKNSEEPKFVRGELYEQSIEVNGIKIDALAEVEIEGKKLILKDLAVYSNQGNIPNQIGASEFVKWLNSIKHQAQSDGFEELYIRGKRAQNSTSATPGKEINISFKLK